MRAGLNLYDDLPALLRHAAGAEGDEAARWLLACAEAMRCAPSLTLERAAAQVQFVSLKERDLAALAPLWHSIGKTCGEESREAIEAVRRDVGRCAAEARARLSRNRRLAGALGCIGSLAMFLFLM